MIKQLNAFLGENLNLVFAAIQTLLLKVKEVCVKKKYYLDRLFKRVIHTCVCACSITFLKIRKCIEQQNRKVKNLKGGSTFTNTLEYFSNPQSDPHL